MVVDNETWKSAQKQECEHWAKALGKNKVRDTGIRVAQYASAMILGRLWILPWDWADKTVIDIGCGPTGRLSAMEWSHVIGIDPLWGEYEKMPGAIKEPYRTVYACEAEKHLEELDGTADLVVSLNAIDHCRDPEAVLRNMATYCKAGGTMLLSTDVQDGVITTDPMHPTRATTRTIDDWMLQCGMDVVAKDHSQAFPDRDVIGRTGAWMPGWSGGVTAWHWLCRKL